MEAKIALENCFAKALNEGRKQGRQGRNKKMKNA
jgi:hypothetical protein